MAAAWHDSTISNESTTHTHHGQLAPPATPTHTLTEVYTRTRYGRGAYNCRITRTSLHILSRCLKGSTIGSPWQHIDPTSDQNSSRENVRASCRRTRDTCNFGTRSSQSMAFAVSKHQRVHLQYSDTCQAQRCVASQSLLWHETSRAQSLLWRMHTRGEPY